ncbi:MAG: hypothetical protein Ta2D_09820 [Rickettsiales bacterium]|nr:MAG: hypothetical protein Ta2D_09820 [Rickettsiales bacterium]
MNILIKYGFMFENQNRNEIIREAQENANKIIILDTNVLTDEHLKRKSTYTSKSFVVEVVDKDGKKIIKGTTIILPLSLINSFSYKIDEILASNSKKELTNFLEYIDFDASLPRTTDKKLIKQILLNHIKNKYTGAIKDSMYYDEENMNKFYQNEISFKKSDNNFVGFYAGGNTDYTLNYKPFKTGMISANSFDFISIDGININADHSYTHELIHLTQQYDKEKKWYQFAQKQHSTIKDDSIDFFRIAIEVHAEIGSYLLDLNNKIKELKREGGGKVDEAKLYDYLIKMFDRTLTRTYKTNRRNEGYNETTSILRNFLKGMTKEDLLKFGDKSVERVREIYDDLTLKRLEKLAQPSEKKNKRVEEVDKDFAGTRPSRIELYNKMAEDENVEEAVAYKRGYHTTVREPDKVAKVIFDLDFAKGKYDYVRHRDAYDKLHERNKINGKRQEKINNFRENNLKNKDRVTKQEVDKFLKPEKHKANQNKTTHISL